MTKLIFLLILNFMSFIGLTQINNVTLDTLLYQAENKYAIYSKQGIISQHDWRTNEIVPIKGDSLIVFANTLFVNLGGTLIITQGVSPNDQTKNMIGGTWYCLERVSNKLIGTPYSYIGSFNQEGYAVAQQKGADYFIGITQEGKEIKANFHLVTNPILIQKIADTSFSTLSFFLKQKKLIDNTNIDAQQKEIKARYHFNYLPYYDENGEISDDTLSLEIFEKSNYFNYQTNYPINPIWEFNFFEKYSYLSNANNNGWHWAIPKSANIDGIIDFQLSMDQVVLVNNNGEEKTRSNYIPITSQYCYQTISNIEFHWEDLDKHTAIFNSLHQLFPLAKNLSLNDFHKLYRDSLTVFSKELINYDPDINEEWISYELFFYKTNNLQLINLPPPSEVQYKFTLKDINKLNGAGDVFTTERQPNLIKQLVIENNTIANVFGNKKIFVFPNISAEYSLPEKQEYIQKLLSQELNERTKSNLEQHKYFEKLIQLGFADPININQYETLSDSDRLFIQSISFDHQVYSFVPNYGLAIENNWILPQNYLCIAKQNFENLILIDTSFQAFNFSISTKKITILKDKILQLNLELGLILKDKNTLTYSIYPSKFLPTNSFDKRNINEAMLNIKRIYQIDNCESINLKSISGEDSIVNNLNNEMEYMYQINCDTNIYSGFSNLPPTIIPSFFELYDGNVINYFGDTIPPMHFSQNKLQAQIQLNDFNKDSLIILEKGLNLQLSLENGKTIIIPKEIYLKVAQLQPGENGYGGVTLNKQFYPYSTLSPFPEKHKIHIHLYDEFWLVGTNKELMLIRLNSKGIVSHYPEKFNDFMNYISLLSKEYSGDNPIRTYLMKQ